MAMELRSFGQGDTGQTKQTKVNKVGVGLHESGEDRYCRQETEVEIDQQKSLILNPIEPGLIEQ
jgi:hypothetical protein